MKLINTTNVVIDWETMSTRSNAVVIALGVIKFQILPKGIRILESDKICIEWMKHRHGDAHLDPKTIVFWMEQVSRNPELLNLVSSNSAMHIGDVLEMLNSYWCSNTDYIWSQGIAFDGSILQWYKERVTSFTGTDKDNMQYFKYMDVRTLSRTAGIEEAEKEEIKDYCLSTPEYGLSKHDPLFDCFVSLCTMSYSLSRLRLIEEKFPQ